MALRRLLRLPVPDAARWLTVTGWQDLTAQQLHALDAVCDPDELFDTVVTWRGGSMRDAAVVNAKAASSLERLGLATCHTNPEYRGNRLVEPTTAGRRAWRAWMRALDAES